MIQDQEAALDTYTISTIRQEGLTWRNSVYLVQSSLNTPQTESLPTCQEGQVGTSQDSHPRVVLLALVSDRHPEFWRNSRPRQEWERNGKLPRFTSQLCWPQSGLESRGGRTGAAV